MDGVDGFVGLFCLFEEALGSCSVPLMYLSGPVLSHVDSSDGFGIIIFDLQSFGSLRNIEASIKD